MFTSERFLICIPLETFIFGFVCFLGTKIIAKNLSIFNITLVMVFIYYSGESYNTRHKGTGHS